MLVAIEPTGAISVAARGLSRSMVNVTSPDVPVLPREAHDRSLDRLDPLTLLLHEVYAIDTDDPDQREVERDAQRMML